MYIYLCVYTVYTCIYVHIYICTAVFCICSFLYIYISSRDWIQDLSAYVTSSFLRAAQLGLQIKEQWLVENAAIYMWNYSRHSLVAEDFRLLLPSFQCLVTMLRELQNPGYCLIHLFVIRKKVLVVHSPVTTTLICCTTYFIFKLLSGL